MFLGIGWLISTLIGLACLLFVGLIVVVLVVALMKVLKSASA